MSAEPRTLVDTISEAESQYQEAAELIKNTSEQTEHVADALLETYDRNLDPDDLAYVDLDNPASELFKHLEVEIPEYEHAFEFKPSPWPTSLWLNEMHRTLVDETPGIRGDLTDPLESIFGRPEGWTGDMFTTATTSLFHYAADNVSNQYIGDINDEEDWIQNPFNAEPDEEELGIISRNHDYTVEILRKVYGDTVPVFRGISPSTRNPSASKPTRISDDFVTACEDTTEFLHHHRPIESWTFDPGYAARYARGRAPDGESGVLLARDVHTSQILATSATTFALNQYEAEALVMHPQETIYPASHIHPADSLTNQTITEFALDAIANITAPIQKQ